MPDDLSPLPGHGAAVLRGLRVDACGPGLPWGGEQAVRDFDVLLAACRLRHRRAGGRDPFGDIVPDAVAADALESALTGGLPAAAGLVQGAIEEFARSLARMIQGALSHPDWRGTQRLVVGGGVRPGRVADIAVGRAAVLLRREGLGCTITPIRHPQEEAGLLGAARLVPLRLLQGADAVLAASLDRAGCRAALVLPRLGVAPELAAAGIWRLRHWTPATAEADRDEAVAALAGLLAGLTAEAEAAGLALAPAIGLGLGAVVTPEGGLGDGAEALPGDWSPPDFRPVAALLGRLHDPGGSIPPTVLMHHGVVLQGLSDAPFQRDVARWGVLTLGADAGYARFTNLPMRR